jgi:proteic killer suppression protein
MPIRNFRHKGLRRLFVDDDARGVPPQLATKLRDMLAAVDTADSVGEIALFPGWRLHELKGEYDGYWSLTVTGNLRVIFRFESGDAFDLELIDYH